MRIIYILQTITFLLILNSFCFAQSSHFIKTSGGGDYNQFQKGQCITDEFRTSLNNRLEINRAKLVEEGILSPKDQINTRNVTKFDWPLRQSDQFNHNSYFQVVNYVDLNSSGSIQDYECGERSYDGHQGIDYSLWPFAWLMMENDQVEVVAGAPGVIIGKDDGNFDMNCSLQGSWNAVYIEHADGSRAYYGHLKNNSLTSKLVGSNVESGDYLGIVGSSGYSTGPHLHLEIRNPDQSFLEPHTGDCNETITETWWNDQRPYRVPTLNHIQTHDAPPEFFGPCPDDETPNIRNEFAPDDFIYFGSYFADQQEGDLTEFAVMDPNGTVIDTWTHTSPDSYSASFWWWSALVPLSAEIGEWTFAVTYHGVTLEHTFNVTFDSPTEENSLDVLSLFPNPSNDYLNIEFPSHSNYSMVFRNVNGKIAFTHSDVSTSNVSIDISDLENGVYFLEILDLSTKRKIVKKFLKEGI